MTQAQQAEQQTEAKIASYLRWVALQPSVGYEVRLILRQQAYAIESGQYKEGDRSE